MLATRVTAGIDDFLGIIIFLVVIGRIVAAIKKATSGASAGKKAPGGKRQLEKDLERFFENLANQDGDRVTDIAPPPPPVPVAVKQAPRRAAPVAARRAQPVVAATPAPTSAVAFNPPPPKPSKVWSGRPFGPSVPTGATCSQTGSVARTDIVRTLKNKDDIRQAILLREILGPPVSMRT